MAIGFTLCILNSLSAHNSSQTPYLPWFCVGCWHSLNSCSRSNWSLVHLFNFMPNSYQFSFCLCFKLFIIWNLLIDFNPFNRHYNFKAVNMAAINILQKVLDFLNIFKTSEFETWKLRVHLKIAISLTSSIPLRFSVLNCSISTQTL